VTPAAAGWISTSAVATGRFEPLVTTVSIGPAIAAGLPLVDDALKSRRYPPQASPGVGL